jgi:hypothetical protein
MCLSIIKEEEPESKPKQESFEDRDYPPLPEGTKLYVGNIPFNIDSEGLTKQFEPSRGPTPSRQSPAKEEWILPWMHWSWRPLTRHDALELENSLDGMI